MCHGGRRHGRRGFGRGLGARWYEHGNVTERLEEYQRDLEQELADVAELLKRLRQSGPEPSPETVQL